jgi:helicase
MITAPHTLLYTDVVGSTMRPEGPRLADLPLPPCLIRALTDSYDAEVRLSPPQVWAVDNGIIDSRRSFLISAPTNSGKTLIAILRMFASAIEKHSRHVFVVPLKALAEEKADEFRALAARIATHGGPPIEVVVSTGDYQRTNDLFGSPPPAQGQIFICTPERLEVILRNPDNHAWARQIDTYFIDEFHLLGEKGRGATLEVLLTRLLVLCPDSSVVGLSATIGGIASITAWLATARSDVRHCEQTYRFPMLRRNVVSVKDKDAFVLERLGNVLADPQSSILIFVYKKADAEALAKLLQDNTARPEQVGFFHAGLSLAGRNRVIQGFRQKSVRALVTTTSLKMGVNTPATEVIVRDITFHGVGRLRISDLLQMVGRAGRGETPGQAWILVQPQEDASFTDDLASGRIDEIKPQLLPTSRFKRPSNSTERPTAIDPLQAIALTELLIRQQATSADLTQFVGRTYSAFHSGNRSTSLQKQLVELERAKLIHHVENSQGLYCPTKLGRTVSISGLSPESGGMFAAFLRAMIGLSVKQQEQGYTGPGYLRRLTDFDLLFLAVASFEARDYWLPKPSHSTIEDCLGQVESLPIADKPLVNLWRNPSSSEFPTRRLLTSLQIDLDTDDSVAAAKTFYRLLRTSLMLYQHSRGKRVEELALNFDIHSGSFESGLKPTITWVLSCLAQVCDSDKAYKLDFLSLRIFDLLENLSLGATLGKLLRLDGIGRRSVEKLISSGITDLEAVSRMNQNQFEELGLTKSQASAISRFCMIRNR